MSGYSSTPLLKKLGYQAQHVNYVDDFAPYFTLFKDSITLNALQPYDFIYIFVKNQEELKRSMSFALKKLAKNGMLWVSWPKKTAKKLQI
jgi:hypothetical protein